MITVPLTLSSAYLNNYSAVVNPYLSSTHYVNNDDGLYKTIIHPNPIKTFISPLGVAAHNDPVVIHHKYHQHTSPKHKSSSKITISSPLLSPTYNMPIVGETAVNSDPVLRKKMTAYFFEKTLNHWIYSDYDDALKYLVVKDGKVSVIKNISYLEKNKASQDVEKKVDFIANNVMTKYDMKSFLKNLVNKTPANWYDLKQHKSFVKKKIYKKIIKNLQKMMIH
jgi:hypothetical protein